jgi:hypothetical protein
MPYSEEDFQRRQLHLLNHNFCNVNKMSKPKTISYTNLVRWGGKHLQQVSATDVADLLGSVLFKSSANNVDSHKCLNVSHFTKMYQNSPVCSFFPVKLSTYFLYFLIISVK